MKGFTSEGLTTRRFVKPHGGACQDKISNNFDPQRFAPNEANGANACGLHTYLYVFFGET